MQKSDLKKNTLPNKPGIYFFKKGSEILYIGKATNLHDRIGSYFGKDLMNSRGPLITEMVDKSTNVRVQETESALEALILEANLIKKYKPLYNSKEKDNKSFNYVVITNEELPRVFTVRGRELEQLEDRDKKQIKYSFGPYPQGNLLIEALRIIRKIFPFFGKKTNNKNSYEFYRQLSLAPDTDQSDFKKEYKKTINNVKLFFEGKKTKIIKDLEKRMLQYAKTQEFEKADHIKKQIFALEHLRDISLMKENFDGVGASYDRIEAYDIAHMGGKNMVGVMVVVENGEANKNEYRKFKIETVNQSNDVASLREVLERRLEHTEWQLPKLLIVDGGKAQKNIAEKVLRESGNSIPVIAVVKNEQHKPKALLGRADLIKKYDRQILLANSESHRFAINYFRDLQRKNL